MAGGLGKGEAVFNAKKVWFNGVGDDAHETFYIGRKFVDDGHYVSRDDNKRVFEFCKTSRKPYDLAVVCCLIVFKHYLPNDIAIFSDGDEKELEESKALCQKVLGYGQDFVKDKK